MLTVKHIRLSGEQDIYPAKSAHFVPAIEARHAGQPEAPAHVLVSEAIDVTKRLDGGTVFVTNEQGRTVARYDLGASMVPLRHDPLKTGDKPGHHPDCRVFDGHRCDCGVVDSADFARSTLGVGISVV